MAHPPIQLRLWDLIQQAMALDGARTLHISAGRPPMVRLPEHGIQPLDPQLPILGYREIMILLATVVDPEKWQTLEKTGEGEIKLTPPAAPGKTIVMTLFRSTETWSAVVHL